MPGPESIAFLWPELILAVTAAVLFALAAALRENEGLEPWLVPFTARVGLLAAFAALVLGPGARGATGAPAGDLLTLDRFALYFRGVAIASTLLGVHLAFGSPSVPRRRRNEYLALLLVLALGMCLLASASNLLMIYAAIETVSLVSYLLAGFDDRSGRSPEAGLKYVLYGGVASAVMLFGLTWIYGLTGGLDLDAVHRALDDPVLLHSRAGEWAVILGLVFTLAGLGFKVAAVPFHMWCPDVYEGAPTPFAALLSVGPKAAGFAVLLRFGECFLPGDPAMLDSSERVWLLALGVLSAITMTVGTLSAIPQENLKRLLAYSSIAHAGFLLMGAAAGGPSGAEAVAVYLAAYLVMNFGAFAVVSAVDRACGSEDIRAYRGLGRRAPALAVAMAIFLFSLTGLPPTVGFVGKLYLFAAVLDRGGAGFVLLAVLGILNTVIALFFYARVLRAMYFEPADEALAFDESASDPATRLALLLAVPTLLLGIFWQPLAAIASWAAQIP